MLSNSAVQSVLDELALDDEDFSLPPTPESAAASASALAAAERRAEADRKREERARRRGAGIPDSRVVDGVIATALASVLLDGDAGLLAARSGTLDGLKVSVKPVLSRALKALTDRGVDKRIARQVLASRLLPTPAGLRVRDLAST